MKDRTKIPEEVIERICDPASQEENERKATDLFEEMNERLGIKAPAPASSLRAALDKQAVAAHMEGLKAKWAQYLKDSAAVRAGNLAANVWKRFKAETWRRKD